MVYSCAYFASPDDTLEEAQTRKLELICRKLRLRAGERLLDIGCGWGSLVLHAAREHGVRAVGVTLSEPQAELARERIRDAGLSGRCEVRVADYREVDDGPYDKIASVGMYEHVGRAQLGELRRPCDARCCARVACSSTTASCGPSRGRRDEHSFIARYVFPDGELHPRGRRPRRDGAGRPRDPRRRVAARALRAHAAPLGGQPRRHRDAAIAEAGTERERVWRLYMTGSAVAFEAGDISVHQVLAAKPGAPHELPLAREALLAGVD